MPRSRIWDFESAPVVTLGKGVVFLYVGLASYVIAVYSLIAGTVAFVSFATGIWLIHGESRRDSIGGFALIALSMFLLWKPYEVDVNAIRWERAKEDSAFVEGDILWVTYYEPHALRTRISLKPDESTKTVKVHVWASYFPLDGFFLEHATVKAPPQYLAGYTFKVGTPFEKEHLRWW